MRQDKQWARESMKKWAIAYLGGKCIVCETTENLEFDHIDPSTKEFSIGWSLQRTKHYLLPELEKCQLLCKTHHLEKTARDVAAKHGTRSCYNKGCKCEPCRTANAAYEYSRRHRK